MSTHYNDFICLYKKVDKKEYIDYNLRTMELLDYVLNIGVCAVIRLNVVL